MLDKFEKDSDVLEYNVFGIVHIESDQIIVSANIVRAGRPQERRITHYLDKPLKNFQTVFSVPFGAWLDRKEANVIFPTLPVYDDETFNSNIKIITNVVKKTVELFEGAIS